MPSRPYPPRIPATIVTLLCLSIPAAAAAVPHRRGDVASPARRAEPQPVREGFTIEFGLGVSFTVGNFENELDLQDEVAKVGLAPLSLGLGAFVTDQSALLVRIAGTSYFEEVDGFTEQIGLTVGGVGLQHWFNDRLFGGATLGIGVFGTNVLASKLDSHDRGVAAELRAGYAVLAGQSQALRVSLSAMPGWFPDRQVLGTALNVEWQHY